MKVFRRKRAKEQSQVLRAVAETERWLQQSCVAPTATLRPSAVTNEPLDPWQRQALDALQEGVHVVVDAPTSAGKTRVVEHFFRSGIGDPSFRACYTTPVKSLSNDKVLEFRHMFGSNHVGIGTGDVKENLSAPIVVATLETYRNSLLGVEPDLGRKMVVFDEYHFLGDAERGGAWEEAIILTPRHCQMLLLSASVSNADEIAAWLTSLSGRPARVVSTEHRPVPLEPLVYGPAGWFRPQALSDKELKLLQRQERERVSVADLASRIMTLDALGVTPTIVYVGRRAECEVVAGELTQRLPRLAAPQRQQLETALGESLVRFQAHAFFPQRLHSWIVQYGVAYHHSGLAPKARLVVEVLLKAGAVRFCTSTMGLSLGINFSVRSTLIASAVRPSASGSVRYRAAEILQMQGRAGRRGRDQVGFTCWPSVDLYLELHQAQRGPCRPQLSCDYATLLGLLSRGSTLGQIERFYRQSFASFHRATSSRGRPPLCLLRPTAWAKKLGVAALPCLDPAAEYALTQDRSSSSLCVTCNVRTPCHRKIAAASNPLLALYIHLVRLGAIAPEGKLTRYGNIARYFPQFGGLVVARLLERREAGPLHFTRLVHLFAALALASFKSPRGGEEPAPLPLTPRRLVNLLYDAYPPELFPEYFDYGRHGEWKDAPRPPFREWNLAGAAAIALWVADDGAITWAEFMARVGGRVFSAGDATALIYRTQTFLQSLLQHGDPELGECAAYFRDLLLRPPLDIPLPGEEEHAG